MTYYTEWFISAENRIHMIRKEHILSAALPNKELREEYTTLIRKRIMKELAKAKKSAPKNSDCTGLDFDLGDQAGFSRN